MLGESFPVSLLHKCVLKALVHCSGKWGGGGVGGLPFHKVTAPVVLFYSTITRKKAKCLICIQTKLPEDYPPFIPIYMYVCV